MEDLDNTSRGKDGAVTLNVGANATHRAGAGTGCIRTSNINSLPKSPTKLPEAVVPLKSSSPPCRSTAPTPTRAAADSCVGGDSPSPTTLCTFPSYASYYLTGTAASAGGKPTAYVVPKG